MIYLGFSIEAMLCFLNMYCKEVRLNKAGDGWLIYVLSDKYGEFEMAGSLGVCISQAFKPFLGRAKAQRKEFADQLQKIMAEAKGVE